MESIQQKKKKRFKEKKKRFVYLLAMKKNNPYKKTGNHGLPWIFVKKKEPKTFASRKQMNE